MVAQVQLTRQPVNVGLFQFGVMRGHPSICAGEGVRLRKKHRGQFARMCSANCPRGKIAFSLTAALSGE